MAERLPGDKGYCAIDALKLIRKCIYNSRQARNILDTIDSVAKEAIEKFGGKGEK